MADILGSYRTLLEIVKRMVRWFGYDVVVKGRGTMLNNIGVCYRAKLTGKDHEEDQQDSGWSV